MTECPPCSRGQHDDHVAEYLDLEVKPKICRCFTCRTDRDGRATRRRLGKLHAFGVSFVLWGKSRQLPPGYYDMRIGEVKTHFDERGSATLTINFELED